MKYCFLPSLLFVSTEYLLGFEKHNYNSQWFDHNYSFFLCTGKTYSKDKWIIYKQHFQKSTTKLWLLHGQEQCTIKSFQKPFTYSVQK